MDILTTELTHLRGCVDYLREGGRREEGREG